MLLCVGVMLLVVASDLGLCLDEDDLDTQWEQWKTTYGKEYDDYEEVYRNNNWKKNMRMIEVHNQEAEQGKHSYKLGMNQLGDLDFSPTKTDIYNQGTMQVCPKDDYRTVVYDRICSLLLPRSVDYREEGMVTPVKNQGHCDSCWAFSAVGALEGQLAKKTGKLLELSPQNLVDCDPESDGCVGGHMTDAFYYVLTNGINSERDYPYMEEKQPCRYNASAIAAQCKDFKEIPEGDECILAATLYKVGPLSVAINTNHVKFMLYKSGIYYNPECDKDNISHAVLLVGYGETAEGEKYWIVKNSFGTSWGEDGYMRIARNRDNHCGIASQASYPIM
ncbi:procathepsin L [Lates calcarifer]|uniref:Cathepsin K n=1 Tax=Lates calcarifer TaxID=8187 RepID=A0A4W6D417_LATCA|nr:procathepsin L [Lates calcarifer]XP_050932318.1 procathepsin L [Lates calcarifer]